MEFLQILCALAALLIVMFAPSKEKFAFVVMWLGWLLMIYLYVGHVSGGLLGTINL